MAVRRLMQRVERAERPQMQRELHADLANMMRMLNNDHEDQGVMVMDDEDDPIEADINEPPVEAPPFPGDLPDEPLEPQFPDALGPGTAYLKAAICLSRDHPGGSLRMTRTVHPSALFLEAAHVCCIRGYKMPFKEIWSCLRYYHLSDKGLEVCVPVALRYLWQDGLEIMASTNPHFLYNGFVREHILSQLGINSTYQSVEPENNNGRINEPVYNLNFQLFADLLVLTERIPIMETGIHSIWKLIPSMQRSSLQYDLGRVSLTQAHKKLAIDRLKLIEARGN
ncbi:hypothetical protein L596_017400 [Steinernema carpocapsae]|uniref:Uncharacterized protein n=1 Tax=Steinernema carpocapsae TaxID=34508 RepID=A0A4U5N291_STECR|nr:hypothetical protein L596_017400 [Steinernema carpocapsae]